MVQLIPQPPDIWYLRPGYLKIALAPDEVKPSFFDHDTIITKEIGGEIFDAMVPTHVLGENRNSVPAAYAGHTGDRVILHLPTSNDGRPTWVFPQKYLEDILVKDDTPVK